MPDEDAGKLRLRIPRGTNVSTSQASPPIDDEPKKKFFAELQGHHAAKAA